MTTCAMIGGMLPVALGLGAGGEARAPMAMAVIGGMTTSTLLTLVVIPVVYSLFDGVTTSRPIQFLGRLIFASDSAAKLAPAIATSSSVSDSLGIREVAPTDHLPPDPGPAPDRPLDPRQLPDDDPDDEPPSDEPPPDEPPPSQKKTLIGGF
jgi:HAE1 family hydrophobic/amphiphilic exporter-1